MTARVECVPEARAKLGEVPVWSQREGLLYWVDIRAPSLNALDPSTGANRSWPMPEAIGAVALHARGGLLVALASGLFRFDPATEALTPLQTIEAEISDLPSDWWTPLSKLHGSEEGVR